MIGLSRLNEYLWLTGLNAGLRQFPAQAGKTRAAVQTNQPFPIQTRKSYLCKNPNQQAEIVQQQRDLLFLKINTR